MDAKVISFPDRQTADNPVNESVWLEITFFERMPDHVAFRMLDHSHAVTNAMLADALRAVADTLELEGGNDNAPGHTAK